MFYLKHTAEEIQVRQVFLEEQRYQPTVEIGRSLVCRTQMWTKHLTIPHFSPKPSVASGCHKTWQNRFKET